MTGVQTCALPILWRFDSVIKGYKAQQPGALMVINGSPYEQDKDDVRFSLCSQRARELDTTLAYVNMTGGQDELVLMATAWWWILPAI